jgi:hypothetical protein
MAIRDHRRRAALLGSITAGLAATAIIGGLAPAALADEPSTPASCTDPTLNSCYLNMGVGIYGSYPDDEDPNITVPWEPAAAYQGDPLVVSVFTNLAGWPGGTDCTLDLYVDPVLHGTEILSDPLYAGAGCGSSFGFTSAQWQALTFGQHTLLATNGPYDGDLPGVDNSNLITLTLAPPPDGTVIRDTSSNQLSVVVGGDRVVLPGQGSLPMSKINPLPDSAYQSLPVVMGPAVLAVPGGHTYDVFGQYAVPFASAADLASSGLGAEPVYDVPADVISVFHLASPQTLMNGTLIRDDAAGTDAVMLVGAPVPFAGAAEISAAGLSPSQFNDVPPSFYASLPTQPGMGGYIRGDASTQVYRNLGMLGKDPVSTVPAGVTPIVVSQTWLNSVPTTG